ncbi:MAG: ATP-grasp domain-containing protein [Oscillospiraceae bacterium]|nr:ATP-grasp domain-containing protein [Oscillospiraceae bacterium]
MKKLMVIGATHTQVPLIRTAQRMGYYTIVAGIKGNYPGIDVADEACFVDIRDPKAVLEAAKALRIDGIATCCMDMGVRAVGYVCEAMGLCGLTERAALLSNQKLAMKEAFEKGGVRSPAFRKVSSEADLRKAWEELPQPVILKAVDLQASRGIYVCRSFQELEEAYREAMELTREDFCIVEQFVKGIDIGAQAFVYDGEIVFIVPHNDEVFTGSANKPIGHSAPLIADEATMTEVKRQCELAIRAIGLNNCAVNIDLLEAEDGGIYMIELTGRAGATCLPELVSLYFGVDYYEMIAAMAMGEDPREIFNRRPGTETANASRFLLAPRDGVVKSIRCDAAGDDIALLEIYAKPGDAVRAFQDGADRIGQTVVTGPTVQDCFARLDEISAQLRIEYED